MVQELDHPTAGSIRLAGNYMDKFLFSSQKGPFLFLSQKVKLAWISIIDF